MQFIQAAHAAHEAGIRWGNSESISSIVVCSVPDEAALLSAKRRLDERGIPSYVFSETDLGDQATALATAPLPRAERRALSHYPLWRSA